MKTYIVEGREVEVYFNEHKEITKIKGIPGDLSLLVEMGVIKRVRRTALSVLHDKFVFDYYLV